VDCGWSGGHEGQTLGNRNKLSPHNVMKAFDKEKLSKVYWEWGPVCLGGDVTRLAHGTALRRPSKIAGDPSKNAWRHSHQGQGG